MQNITSLQQYLQENAKIYNQFTPTAHSRQLDQKSRFVWKKAVGNLCSFAGFSSNPSLHAQIASHQKPHLSGTAGLLYHSVTT